MTTRTQHAATIVAACCVLSFLGATPALGDESRRPELQRLHERVERKVVEPLVRSGVMSSEQADQLLIERDAVSAAKAGVVAQYQRKAEDIVASAYGLTVQQYRATPMKRLPKLSRAKRAQLGADIDALTAQMRLALAPSPTSQPSRKPLTVVPKKTR